MSNKPHTPLPDDNPKPAEKPISLKPLKFEEAVEGLLKAKPSREEPDKIKRSEKGE